MRFSFTMNMPSKKDRLVHVILAEHKSADINALFSEISSADFLIVDELYSYTDRDTGVQSLVPHGLVILNSAHIGKIKKLEEY